MGNMGIGYLSADEVISDATTITPVVLQPISISGIGTLNVSGGTLNVAGTDTYSGQTTVLDGILSLQNLNDAGTGVGSVTVSASSTLDGTGGTGGTGGSVEVKSNGIPDPRRGPCVHEEAGFHFTTTQRSVRSWRSATAERFCFSHRGRTPSSCQW